MKRFATTVLVFAFFVIGSASAAVQHFSCFPMDTVSTDRSVVSLDSAATNGTLFRTSGLNYWGEQDTTGVVKIAKREETVSTNVYSAENPTSLFTVEVPKDVIGKSSDEVYVRITQAPKVAPDQVLEDTLFCYSRLY